MSVSPRAFSRKPSYPERFSHCERLQHSGAGASCCQLISTTYKFVHLLHTLQLRTRHVHPPCHFCTYRAVVVYSHRLCYTDWDTLDERGAFIMVELCRFTAPAYHIVPCIELGHSTCACYSRFELFARREKSGRSRKLCKACCSLFN